MMIQALALQAALLLLLGSPQAATLAETANSEGDVVLYSSLNNEQIVTLVEAFRKNIRALRPRSTAAGERSQASEGLWLAGEEMRYLARNKSGV
jgi:hypothetical protein